MIVIVNNQYCYLKFVVIQLFKIIAFKRYGLKKSGIMMYWATNLRGKKKKKGERERVRRAFVTFSQQHLIQREG